MQSMNEYDILQHKPILLITEGNLMPKCTVVILHNYIYVLLYCLVHLGCISKI